MMEMKFSQKEILIFQGFSKLVDDGISLNNIKVSDIAKSAGIGKGTIYEYFKTKEEVIAKSIMYKMNVEFVDILEKSNEAVGFEDKCKVGFEEIMRFMSNQFEYFQIMFTSKEIHEALGCSNKEKNCVIELRNHILELLEPTIKLGLEEKIINSNLDIDYIRSVFISVCSGIGTMVHFQFGQITNEDIEKQKNIAYTMLVKALS